MIGPPSACQRLIAHLQLCCYASWGQLLVVPNQLHALGGRDALVSLSGKPAILILCTHDGNNPFPFLARYATKLQQTQGKPSYRSRKEQAGGRKRPYLKRAT